MRRGAGSFVLRKYAGGFFLLEYGKRGGGFVGGGGSLFGRGRPGRFVLLGV